MVGVSLPLTFNNSFWTQDYRTGLETLYGKLLEGCAENEEIVNFIKARVAAEKSLAQSLIIPAHTGPRGRGFGADDGASLLATFKGLQAESVAQGQVHQTIARDLEKLVVEPFSQWADKHKERMLDSKTVLVDGWMTSYEDGMSDVAKLRNQYHNKTRLADEAEDDARLAPSNEHGDKFTPPVKTNQKNGHVNRTASVSERIAQRLGALRQGVAQGQEPPPIGGGLLSSPVREVDVHAEDTKEVRSPEPIEKDLPKVDKGKGKAEDGPASPPPQPPTKVEVPERKTDSPIILAGIVMTPENVGAMIERAKKELPLRPIRFPLLGEYQDCFSGMEFVAWLKDNVDSINGNADKAELFARDLAERENALRRLGELGNRFDSTSDAYYQFRARTYGATRKDSAFSPTEIMPPNLAPAADNLLKRSKTFLSVVQSAVGAATSNDPVYIRARRDAQAAEKEYQISVRKLDRQRLGLEERIEDTLKLLQRWEAERLRAVKTVLLQYQGTLATQPSGLQSSLDKASSVIAAYQPEQDLVALIERYKTGPFKPTPQVFESVDHVCDVAFGIDLRLWAGEGVWMAIKSSEKEKSQVPPILASLLGYLKETYPKLSDDSERRRVWIYDVPLVAVHHLRESINSLALDASIPTDMLEKFDVPVIASTVKLWFLELNPPVGLWEGWEDIRKLYPTVGSTRTGEESDGSHIERLNAALLRLPRVHLLALDALIDHLKSLVEMTNVESESKELYVNKLGLSLGRAILRPRHETEISIQDRHSTLFLMDLIHHYEQTLPPTILKKKRESDTRAIPIRKRTRPVDVRVSRSRLSVGADPRKVLEEQLEVRGVRSRNPSPEKQSAPVPAPITPSKQDVPDDAPTPRVKDFAAPAPSGPDDDLPPRPNFVEPPPEAPEDDIMMHSTDSTEVVIQPPSPGGSKAGTNGSIDQPVSKSGAVDLKRSVSAESSRIRGPRTTGPRTTGPRAPGRASVSGGSVERGHASAGSFSRRTQESDAEENVVGQ